MGVVQALFSFEGRLRRRDWWLWTIAVMVAYFILLRIGVLLMGGVGGAGSVLDQDDSTLIRFTLIQAAMMLLVAWPLLAVGFKRLHDRGHSGRALVLLYLMMLIEPALTVAGKVTSNGTSGLLRLGALLLAAAVLFIGLWLLVVLGVLDGNRGPNRFGSSPKEDAALPAPALAD